MMKINYDLFPYKKIRTKGQHTIKNAFYLRDIDETDSSDLYEDYHTCDFFGFSLDHAASLLEKDEDDENNH